MSVVSASAAPPVQRTEYARNAEPNDVLTRCASLLGGGDWAALRARASSARSLAARSLSIPLQRRAERYPEASYAGPREIRGPARLLSFSCFSVHSHRSRNARRRSVSGMIKTRKKTPGDVSGCRRARRALSASPHPRGYVEEGRQKIRRGRSVERVGPRHDASNLFRRSGRSGQWQRWAREET